MGKRVSGRHQIGPCPSIWLATSALQLLRQRLASGTIAKTDTRTGAARAGTITMTTKGRTSTSRVLLTKLRQNSGEAPTLHSLDGGSARREAATYIQGNTNTQTHRTHYPSVRASEDSSCVRPLGHCDRQLFYLKNLPTFSPQANYRPSNRRLLAQCEL